MARNISLLFLYTKYKITGIHKVDRKTSQQFNMKQAVGTVDVSGLTSQEPVTSQWALRRRIDVLRNAFNALCELLVQLLLQTFHSPKSKVSGDKHFAGSFLRWENLLFLPIATKHSTFHETSLFFANISWFEISTTAERMKYQGCLSQEPQH